MPTSFVGLLIFIGFLTPGFLYAGQRRALVPQAERSPLMETAAVVSVSLATNALVIALFGVVRWLLPGRTPDVGALLRSGADYAVDHLPYVLGWATVLLVGSCAIAVGAARIDSYVPKDNVRGRVLTRLQRGKGRLGAVLPPVIIESSAWCETLRACPGNYVHAGLELAGGCYVSGRVVWFSTGLEETGDRELVLGPPLKMRTAEGVIEPAVERVVVSAREIRRMDVDQVRDTVRQPGGDVKH